VRRIQPESRSGELTPRAAADARFLVRPYIYPHCGEVAADHPTGALAMNKLISVAAALALASGAALAHNCPNEMKAIDAKLATNPSISAADIAKIKVLRADGEAAHKAGKHDDSMKALGEAKKMLGI
jgi:hypothetical protein